jgi:PIN domain nuclease of toxin-antitoxin system
MRVLLDTHVLLWSLASPHRITGEAAQAFRERVTSTVVSAANLWEIAIKRSLGKLDAPDDLPEIVRGLGHEILPVRMEHAWRVSTLPAHHNDPFDRILVAQAMIEDLTLVTHDAAICAYDVKVLLT